MFGTRYKRSAWILEVTVPTLAGFEAFCKAAVQDVRMDGCRIMIGMMSVFVLFWRCIPVVSKTLNPKYSTKAKLLFNGETCFSVPGCSTLELSCSFVGKDHLKVASCGHARAWQHSPSTFEAVDEMHEVRNAGGQSPKPEHHCANFTVAASCRLTRCLFESGSKEQCLQGKKGGPWILL